ncbi:hypothetical protein NHQ30_005782 [Ciborinia camelliae]|nr:hypothetical protein NHQ30_005782 [Ciborinia camelliae]
MATKERLRCERLDRIQVLRKKHGAKYLHRNPILPVDVIKECGAESCRELEDRLDMKDVRDAASWELATRQVADTRSRKNRKFTFQKQASPLKRELEKLEDHCIPEHVLPYYRKDNTRADFSAEFMERKRKQLVEAERKRVKMEDDKKRAAWRKKDKVKQSRALEENQERERRDNENREKYRVAWENRERSDCRVTQAWIDMGVEMARFGKQD